MFYEMNMVTQHFTLLLGESKVKGSIRQSESLLQDTGQRQSTYNAG